MTKAERAWEYYCKNDEKGRIGVYADGSKRHYTEASRTSREQDTNPTIHWNGASAPEAVDFPQINWEAPGDSMTCRRTHRRAAAG
jgi:hypothetical protein